MAVLKGEVESVIDLLNNDFMRKQHLAQVLDLFDVRGAAREHDTASTGRRSRQGAAGSAAHHYVLVNNGRGRLLAGGAAAIVLFKSGLQSKARFGRLDLQQKFPVLCL